MCIRQAIHTHRGRNRRTNVVIDDVLKESALARLSDIPFMSMGGQALAIESAHNHPSGDVEPSEADAQRASGRPVFWEKRR